MLVRPGAAAGLGVHTPHQVLDLLDVEAPGEATGYSIIIPGDGKQPDIVILYLGTGELVVS